jgi:hypothetical protein
MEELILRHDNFIDDKKCAELISKFESNLPLTQTFRDTIILPFRDPVLLVRIKQRFSFFNFQKVDALQLVKWPTGSKMAPHLDKGDVMSFILYLNDNYQGGETIIDGVSIKPKQGRLVIFSNGFYKHEVKEITNGTRYTLIAWYR